MPGEQAELRPEVATFLFTDIEGSTRLLERLGDDFAPLLDTHHRVLRKAIQARHGEEVRTEGDSFFAVFASPANAIACAADIQRGLAAESWPADGELRVRIGVHTGEALRQGGDWVGLAVHRAARIMSVGWGGQVLVSQATREVVAGALDDLGLELVDLGDHRLKDLTEATRLFQLGGQGLAAEHPALRTLDAVRHNLPIQPTSFIGRDAEVHQVVDLLENTRVLTLTGPGGTGKTRLSLQVAAEVADDFPDGAWFVALDGITDPTLVMSAVAEALSLNTSGDDAPLEIVIRHLVDRRALLVLDNLEQVIEAAPDIAKLIAACGQTRVLGTSRIPLQISGEQEYPVPPLSVPEEPGPGDLLEVGASEAVVLFVARAAAVQPGFALTADNASAIARIARRLDGMPLALELAAARVKLLPVDDLVERLTHRLDALGTGGRDRPDRQRTLRGAIDWSYDLLTEPARVLFERCSVFMGGMALDAAEQVCGPGLDEDVLDGIAHLVDHSLLRRLPEAVPARFAMYETIREYAWEQLEQRGDRSAVRDRHLAAFLALAEEAAPQLTTAGASDWLDRLEGEHDNLRAALDWAVASGNAAGAMRLGTALWRMWQIRGHLLEGGRRMSEIVAMDGASDDPALLAAALEACGGVHYWLGEMERARDNYGGSLELYRRLEDKPATARGLYNLSFASFPDGIRMQELGREALAIYEELGDEHGIAQANWGLSVGGLWANDWNVVLERGDLALAAYRTFDDTFGLSWALHMSALARIGLEQDLPKANALVHEALDLFAASHDVTGAYLCSTDMAMLLEQAGEYEDAVRLLGAAERLRDDLGTDLLAIQEEVLPRIGAAEAALDPDRVRALKAEGGAWSLEELFDFARSRQPF
ncbi:MAG: adenylate/guanylate cyclase domain-containing protein [Nitriliruptorales bacterium]|nr:adenylate/guanylate cyclase domain-containing protein [Nitriliruptorales bacterium]